MANYSAQLNLVRAIMYSIIIYNTRREAVTIILDNVIEV